MILNILLSLLILAVPHIIQPISFHSIYATTTTVRWAYMVDIGIDAVRIRDGSCLPARAGYMQYDSFKQLQFIEGRSNVGLDETIVYTDNPSVVGVWFDYDYSWPDNLTSSQVEVEVDHGGDQWEKRLVPGCASNLLHLGRITN